MYKRNLGDQAESFVAAYLSKQGYAICERNYQKMYGEIDIIAKIKNLLVFVEVKVRRRHIEHMPEIITPTKQHKIGLVAKEYISRHDITDMFCQFDVALVSMQSSEQFSLSYIENAFTIE